MATAAGRRADAVAEFAIAEAWWQERGIAALRLADTRADGALEAARGLMRWAADQGVKRVVASTGVGKAASAAVARWLGFVRVGI